ncbi:radical SAM/SPASM domain-containing protein [Spirochaetota bacterium]
MIRFRYESFGGIVASSNPPFLAYINKYFARILGYKKSRLWEESSIYLSAPTEVHLSVTNECPVRCSHCYMDSGEKLPNELSFDEIKESIDVLAEKGVFSIALGGGEAFIRTDIFAIAQHAREKGIVPNLSTNGYLINDELARKCGVFGQVNVSIDSTARAENIRDDRLSAKAIDAVKILRKHGIRTGINAVITRKSFENIEELYSFARKNKIKEIEFLRIKPSGRAKQVYHDLKCTPEQYKDLFPMLMKLAKKYRITTKIDCSLLPMVCYHKPRRKRLIKFAAYGCEAGNVLLGVKADGSVSPCSFAGPIGFPITKIDDFWHSSEILNTYRTWTEHAPEPCITCQYLDICKGGCHPLALFETGDFFSGDPGCPYVHDHSIMNEEAVQ